MCIVASKTATRHVVANELVEQAREKPALLRELGISCVATKTTALNHGLDGITRRALVLTCACVTPFERFPPGVYVAVIVAYTGAETPEELTLLCNVLATELNARHACGVLFVATHASSPGTLAALRETVDRHVPVDMQAVTSLMPPESGLAMHSADGLLVPLLRLCVHVHSTRSVQLPRSVEDLQQAPESSHALSRDRSWLGWLLCCGACRSLSAYDTIQIDSESADNETRT